MQNNPETQLTRLTALRPVPHAIALPAALRNSDVSLGEIWSKIWKRRVAAVLCAAGIFAAVALYTFLKRPVYESIAQICLVSSPQGSLGLADLVSQHMSDSDIGGGRLQTELTI